MYTRYTCIYTICTPPNTSKHPIYTIFTPYIHHCRYVDELAEFMAGAAPGVVYTMRGKNDDSGNYAKEATFDGIEGYRVDNGRLYPEVVECRVIKSAEEIKLMRHINHITSDAHMAVMARCKPGMKEFQLESLFQHWSYFRGGCRHSSYTNICGCGVNSAVLHYGHAGAPNQRTIEETDMSLMDMGGEYHCYTSDVTCSFPANGTFSPDQKAIYEAVLAAQFAVMDAMKPGVSYIDMHTLANRTICEHLSRATLGLLVGDIEALMDANMGAVFMPHGLGHLMGLDTHDVGGRPQAYVQSEAVSEENRALLTKAGYKSLRMVRALEEGMVLTVEPGW